MLVGATREGFKPTEPAGRNRLEYRSAIGRMDRRALLAALAGTGIAGVAGCLEERGAGEPAETEPTATPSGQSSTPEPARLVDRSLTVRESGCGGEYGTSEATIGDELVTVEGTISGNNSCYTARLADADYDEAADELAVVVESRDDSGENEICQSCIVAIDYTARFEFENGQPASVTVEHRGVDGA
jgi:hypothetical protein